MANGLLCVFQPLSKFRPVDELAQPCTPPPPPTTPKTRARCQAYSGDCCCRIIKSDGEEYKDSSGCPCKARPAMCMLCGASCCVFCTTQLQRARGNTVLMTTLQPSCVAAEHSQLTPGALSLQQQLLLLPSSMSVMTKNNSSCPRKARPAV
jgi:hypothetical protein